MYCLQDAVIETQGAHHFHLFSVKQTIHINEDISLIQDSLSYEDQSILLESSIMLPLTIFANIVVEDSSIRRKESCDKWSPVKFGNIEISVVVELYLEVDTFFQRSFQDY